MASDNQKRQSQFVRWMGPILDAIRELSGSGQPREISDMIATQHKVSDKVLQETLKSGQTRFYNQLHWARQYLVWEGLLDGSTRGVWELTPKGYKTKLNEESAREIFLKWVRIHADARKNADQDKSPIPSEIETEVDDHRQVLLEILKKLSPKGFEHVCGLLLRRCGFERVTITGGPKDEGIDGIGILQVNPFVKFKVLFQCKKYEKTVGRSHVANFRNSMIGRADKGIILTTGTFTADARREAERDGAPPVELVDGEMLIKMFEQVQLGVKPTTVYEVDHAFFVGFLDGI